jgi:3-oxoacyl-(acyl-carrier-protein) synthase
VAAEEALADSGLELHDSLVDRIGVLMGSAVGGTTALESEYVLGAFRDRLEHALSGLFRSTHYRGVS